MKLCARALIQPKPIYLAVHVNHPEEVTEPVVGALRRLSESGVALLSQTVLLKGVNDNALVLEALFRRLVLLKVRPYYLHHPDLAPVPRIPGSDRSWTSADASLER